MNWLWFRYMLRPSSLVVNGYIGATSPGCAVLLITLLTGGYVFLAEQRMSVFSNNSLL